MLKIENGEIIYDTEDELEAFRLGYEEGLRDGLKKGAELERIKIERERIIENANREWDEKKRLEAERLCKMEEAEKDRRIRNEMWQLRNAAYSRK